MAISPGQPVTAAVVNAEFASKVDNTSFAGIVSFNNTTESTDKDTGSAVIKGGLGVSKNANIEGQVMIGANINSTDKDTGALVVKNGGLGVEQSVYAGSNITAGGSMSASNLSGTNTGDMSIAALGVAPNANGLTLSGQVLNIEPASASYPGAVSTATQSFAGQKTFVDDVIISQNLTVNGDATFNGTSTFINTVNLEIEDQNIILNNNGDDTSAQGAGITIERTGTHGSIVYDSSSATKFKVGNLGSEVAIADISTAQTLTNKTIDAASNSISNIANSNVSASAAIDVSKLAALTASKAVQTNASGYLESSAVSNTELGYLTGSTSNIQTQLNDLKLSGWRKYTVAHSSLQAPGTSSSVILESPTDMVVSSVIVSHSVQAAGSGITKYELSVGITGAQERFTAKYDASQVVSSTIHHVSNQVDIPVLGTSYDIKLFAYSTGANLDQSTAGTFVIYVKLDKLP